MDYWVSSYDLGDIVNKKFKKKKCANLAKYEELSSIFSSNFAFGSKIY